MEIRLGTLEIVPALEHTELVASSVLEMLRVLPNGGKVGVAEIDSALSDTAAFCEYYKIEMALSANCIVLKAVRAEKNWFAACVVLGNSRADINGVVRRAL